MHLHLAEPGLTAAMSLFSRGGDRARLAAETEERDEAVAERARFADPLAHALELAPVAVGFAPRVASLEVSDRPPAGRGGYDVRVVS